MFNHDHDIWETGNGGYQAKEASRDFNKWFLMNREINNTPLSLVSQNTPNTQTTHSIHNTHNTSSIQNTQNIHKTQFPCQPSPVQNNRKMSKEKKIKQKKMRKHKLLPSPPVQII